MGEISSPGPFAELRQKSHSVDIQVLSKWIRQLDDFVTTCEATASAPVSPTDGMGEEPSAIEVEMLEQERDLIAAELSALKEEVALVRSPFSFRWSLRGLSSS